jgi:zinc/manganese transport system ATP-binding protein
VTGPAVLLDGVDCRYGRTLALRSVSLTVERGELVGAVGPSGSGKTTLVRALTGRGTVTSGTVEVFGEPVRPSRPSRDIGYVPQIGTIDASFPLTVEQVALQGLDGRAWPRASRQERSAVAAVLDGLGIGHLAGRPIGRVSGGELQRTFLARALVRRPRLLLLDEPTSGIDLRSRHAILHLLGEVNRSGITVLLTTHDLNFVAAHLPRIVCLAGRVVADGSPAEVFRPDVLRATYGAEVRVIRHGDLLFVADPTHLLRGAPGPHVHEGPPEATPLEQP